MSKKDLFSSIRGSPRGSGCGPSGWRYEHIRLSLRACPVSDHLYKACAVIARGHLPHSISSLLSASRLIAIPKKNGDVRPIAVGEVFRRITAKVICNQLKSNFSDHFSPLQHGVAVEGGSEMLVHHIQLALESNPSWALLKTDMSNAFNSVNRSNLLQQVESSFPEILNHVKQMYANVGHLVYQMEEETVLINSEEGVHQGDPLGPVLFSLTIHPVLKQLQLKHN